MNEDNESWNVKGVINVSYIVRGDYNRVCELCLFVENILNFYLRVKVSFGMKVYGYFIWIWDSYIGSVLLLLSGKKN